MAAITKPIKRTIEIASNPYRVELSAWGMKFYAKYGVVPIYEMSWEGMLSDHRDSPSPLEMHEFDNDLDEALDRFASVSRGETKVGPNWQLDADECRARRRIFNLFRSLRHSMRHSMES